MYSYAVPHCGLCDIRSNLPPARYCYVSFEWLWMIDERSDLEIGSALGSLIHYSTKDR